MFGQIARAWSWLVDGLNEALGMLLDRVSSRAMARIDIAGQDVTVLAPDGAVVGCVRGGDGALQIDPPGAGRRLAKVPVEISVPSSWFFRRHLEPVAAQAAPFLGAFVQHQIDRVTPWRADDVYFGVRQTPLPEDPTRFAVEIGAIPKHLVGAVIALVQSCHPSRLALVTRPDEGGQRFVIPIGDPFGVRAGKRRPLVAMGLAVFLLAWPAALGLALWSMTLLQDEIDDADRVIEQRKAVLSAAAQHDRAATSGETALARLRQTQVRAVDVIDALSAALPDSAYVTDLSMDRDHVRLSGVSTDTPELVPSLERAGRFTDATFFDAITRVENGHGDRFHIELRQRAAATEAGPP